MSPLQVIEVVLPMLCNYLSYWWEKGPENSPSDTDTCTMVTSEHLSSILGNILRILNNNLGIDDAPWMKRIAGKQRDQLGVGVVFFLLECQKVSQVPP